MQRKHSGFTLVELLVTMAVLAVLVGWAIPSFSALLGENRLVASSNQLVGLMNHARGEALRRGDRVWVSPMTQDEVTAWRNGALIWQDRNGDGLRGDDELIRQVALDEPGLRVTGVGSGAGIAPLGFDAAGFSVGERSYALILCADDSMTDGQRLQVTGGGQILMAEHGSCG